MGNRTVIVLPDMHVPSHDQAAIGAIGKYMSDIIVDEVIQLGDFMDIDCISFHNSGKPRLTEDKRLLLEYAIGNDVLDFLQDRSRVNNPQSVMTVLQGNHEYRVDRYLDAEPALEGLIEVPSQLRLDDRGIKWVESWAKGEVHRLGHASFIHGQWTNQHHAKKHCEAYNTNVFYGHVHDVQCFSKVQFGNHKTIVGQSLGCLCEYEQSYMRGRPQNWQQAFATFHFVEGGPLDGNFQYYVTRIFDGQFIAPNGETYSGKTRKGLIFSDSDIIPVELRA